MIDIQYIMLTVAALLLSMDVAMNRIYKDMRGTSLESSLLFNSVLGLTTAVIFFALNKFSIYVSAYSACMAMLMSAAVMAYNIIGFRLLQQGCMAVYSLFLMTGGMILPYIWGVVFLDETVTISGIIGLVVILSGVIISDFGGEKINLKQMCMCWAVFVLNGFVSIISKMHQIEANYNRVGTFEFIMLGGIFKFLIAGALFFAVKNKEKSSCGKKKISKSMAVIILSAVIGGTSYLLQLYVTKTQPATVLYPFITGLSIVFSSLAGAIIFKEKLDRKLIISVALCFAGTIMFI